MDRHLLRAYRFHRENGGYVVGHAAEYALRAARAELLLDDCRDKGIASVDWNPDEDADYGNLHGVLTPDEIQAKFDSGEWVGPFWASLDINDEVAASLSGIVLNSRGTDDPYTRVVEADLAVEVEDWLRQALRDYYDPSL